MSKIRVQVVINDIPSYQNDFSSEADALAASERMARGVGNADKVVNEADLVRYQIPKGFPFEPHPL